MGQLKRLAPQDFIFEHSVCNELHLKYNKKYAAKCRLLLSSCHMLTPSSTNVVTAASCVIDLNDRVTSPSQIQVKTLVLFLTMAMEGVLVIARMVMMACC